MIFSTSLYTRQPRRQASRRELTQQDLFVYEALLGRPAEFHDPAADAAVQVDASSSDGFEPIKAVARRWRPTLTQVKGRIRTMYEQGVAAAGNPQQLGDWLRQMSDQAFIRLDEAQTRLNAARVTPANRRKVVAREVVRIPPLEVDPVTTQLRDQEFQYRRAA